jgi:hypothetical protein
MKAQNVSCIISLLYCDTYLDLVIHSFLKVSTYHIDSTTEFLHCPYQVGSDHIDVLLIEFSAILPTEYFRHLLWSRHDT